MSSCSDVWKEKKRVVVVGGGIAGALIVKQLQFHADVILVDPKEYFEMPWTWLRAMVEPTFAERGIIDHTDYFKNGRLVTATASSVSENEIMTSEGRYISFDYLVIATGHLDTVPMTRMQRLVTFRENHQKISYAKSVLVIGGGPTGVEFCAELVTAFPNKKITLVHSGPRLMEFVGTKAATKCYEWLAARNVDILLEQTVNLEAVTEEGTYETSRGETIVADCHFECTGRKLSSTWLQDTILQSSLDEEGRLAVDQHLRVKGYDHIFAIGDITNITEIKQGLYAQKHAQVAAKNIKNLLKGDKKAKLASYKPGKAIAMVTLGRKEAMAYFPFLTVVGCVPGFLKAKDYFVGRTRKQLGLEPHHHQS
ncbi:hypothetical protein H6P81_015747 [Aristolochia fimbriata]|uniref:FAD/NAD(P)-binding domain-containing protein n=1 Tax=Aristolochia fimbriata TaxID=158543 RepID=A0AAV7E9J3_ARIFI|nr:hypothetical protein H6P81_015747 [Aristolochia fimbriata]